MRSKHRSFPQRILHGGKLLYTRRGGGGRFTDVCICAAIVVALMMLFLSYPLGHAARASIRPRTSAEILQRDPFYAHQVFLPLTGTQFTADASHASLTPLPLTGTRESANTGGGVLGECSVNSYRSRQSGEYPLPEMCTAWRSLGPADLLSMYRNTTFLYSFVNGSEVTHAYRRQMASPRCLASIMAAEKAFWDGEGNVTLENSIVLSKCLVGGAFSSVGNGGDLLRQLQQSASRGVNERDRETDELRHSMRSIEQHIRWHRGRVVIVSPGHHPQWVDAATNFLSSSCGGAPAAAAREDGAHVRVTTVHQDAVMPYGLKLTMNSHVIEQHLWRVKNITSVHVYFNDDYFVNRDVAITDFFNEYGGTIVRTEEAVVSRLSRARGGVSWADGVANTNLFNALELDVRREDELPSELTVQWLQQAALTSNVAELMEHYDAAVAFAEAQGNRYWVDVARTRTVDTMPSNVSVWADALKMRPRHYATHAPFTYCTSMFQHLCTRYEREFAYNALHNRGRTAKDFFIPFVYNAFIMARPWQASPKFLPVAMRRHAGYPQSVVVFLDNVDGCAPATEYSGSVSQVFYTRMTDDVAANAAAFEKMKKFNPLFFNINAGFKSEEASQQLVKFLSTKFTKPVYVERGASEELRALYDALMGLPVVVLTSFSEGVCPAVRSLQLWLPDHRGSVVGIVQRFGDDSDPALSELRQTLRHRVRSAMPAVACALDSARVRVVEWERERTVADVLSAAGPSAVVPLPASCGVGGSADGSVSVRAIVVDARTASGGVELDARWLRGAVTVPGQTVALEDFDVVRMADGAAVLVLSRAAADAKGVHWIDGASESDLLLTFPLPYPPYEDMLAPVKWLD